MCSICINGGWTVTDLTLEPGSTISLDAIGEKLTKQPRTKIDKVSAELVTLTYGTVVAQLCRDFDSDYNEVNKQLDKMGYNIGMRLIEDFLAKASLPMQCKDFRETAEVISKVSSQTESRSSS